MEYRTLGKTGVRVSTYALGTMMFGADGNPDEKECIEIVHAALDAGVNLIDTADTYSHGEAEDIVGKAIAGHRDEIVLSSKVRLRAGDGPNEQGASRLWIMRQVEASLKRLRTDHIDLYQIHRPDLDTDLEETLDVLTDLVRDGKIRYFGCSMFPAWYQAQAHSISAQRGLKRFVSETSPYSIFVRSIELDVLPSVQHFGMGLLAWSPLNGGWLTGKYRRDAAVPSDSRAGLVKGQWGEHYPILRTRFDLSRPGNQRKRGMSEQLSSVASEAGMALAQMALAFPLAHPGVTCVNFGVRNMRQFNDAKAGSGTRLTDDVLNATDARTEAADIATADAVVRSGPPAAADCDAVSDPVRHMDELPEVALLRAQGLRWAREFRGYVVVARILGDDLHFARIHGRVARAIARPWGTCRAGPEQPETRRCGAARAHAGSLDAVDGGGRNDLAMAVQPVVWTDQLLHPRARPVSRPDVG